MKKFFFISGLVGGMLPAAFFMIQPPKQPSANHTAAVYSYAAPAADLKSSSKNVNANSTAELIPPAVRAQHPEESETQKLMDAIRAALRSGEDANWYLISQNELAELIKRDPQAAADLALSLPPGFIREQMLRQVAHGWADQNSTTALAWASALTDTEDRVSALTDICIQMSQANPAAAITTATQYGLAEQPGLLESMTQQWAAKDAAAALGWADQLPASAERDEVMISLAFIEAQVSPADAINLVAYEIPPGSQQDEAIMSVLHQWALRDFAAASTWANQFEDSLLRERAKQELTGIARYSQASN